MTNCSSSGESFSDALLSRLFPQQPFRSQVTPHINPACSNLVSSVREIGDIEDLRARHTNVIIQHEVRRIIEDTERLTQQEGFSPFPEGVPRLDYYGKDVRVRLNAGMRTKQLVSGPAEPGDRTLTEEEFKSLVEYVDYMIHLGNLAAYEDLPHALGCWRDWVEKLPLQSSADFTWP